MDGQTDLGKFSPFHRTLSPIGAAAQLSKGRFQSNKSPSGIKWSAVLLPCSNHVCNEFFLCFLGRKWGSVLIGDKVLYNRVIPNIPLSPLLSICPSIYLSVYPLFSLRPGWVSFRPGWLGLRLAGPGRLSLAGGAWQAKTKT